MKAGGGAKRNASIEQGMQVSTATQRAAGTVTLRNSVEILTNLYTYHGQPRGREGCLLYTSPSPRDLSTSRMPSSA